ncbi:MAG: hypothetical protein AAFN74_00660, partial [Myxococcota bacterium]
MFISVQIRGPTTLVRRRTGEEVSNPVMEFEDGGGHEDHSSRFDLRHRVIDPNLTDLEAFELPADFDVLGIEERLVAAANSSKSHSEGEQRDLESENETRRRAELDRPLELRRLLSQMHELSMLARPAKHTFIKRMDNGLARATLRVWRGRLNIGASIQSFQGVASHLARAGSARPAVARLRGEGNLDPDGTIHRLRLDVELDALPQLGPLEQAELDRLKTMFVRLHAAGMAEDEHREWLKRHIASTERRPELPLMLLVDFITDLERRAFGLLDTPKQAKKVALTLNDVLEQGDDPRASVTQKIDRSTETRLIWIDDHTP